MAANPYAHIEELLDQIGAADSPEAAAGAIGEMQGIVHTLALKDDDIFRHLEHRRDEIEAQLSHYKVSLASLQARMMMLNLADCHVETDIEDEVPIAFGGPQPERLLAGMVLHQHTHEMVPFDEENVARCLDPARAPDFTNYSDVFATATGILRTATYFVLDAKDSRDALASEPPDQDTFPPLPFPRVWIEMSYNRRPVPYLRFVSDNPDRVSGPDETPEKIDVLGVGIVEISQGHLWDLYIAFETSVRQARTREPFFVALRLSPTKIVDCDTSLVRDPDGNEVQFSPTEPSEWAQFAAERIFRGFRQIAVGGVHLICARNVPHEEIALGRGQRKRLERIEAPKPKLYYVDLGLSGERASDPNAQPTGRVYHVRWLVRGHWRHIDGGDRLCSCCDPQRVAVWIDPYIKGPVGAPWKGRPIHRAARA